MKNIEEINMKMTSEMFEEYMKQMKENERLRLSYNKRVDKWQSYLNGLNTKEYRSETSFKMNKFGNEI